MKKSLLAIAILSISLGACKTEKKEVKSEKETPKVEQKQEVSSKIKNNIDIKSSSISWKGTKPTGEHYGTISMKEGSIDIQNNELIGGTFVIDMNTINTKDLEGKSKNDLDGHLKGEDFFDIAKYPTSKFVITKVEKNEGKLTVTGDLTIKETTKSLTVPATLTTVNGVTTFKSETFKVNRTEYGIKYKSKSFFNDLKEKFIHDDVELSFVVTKL